MQLQKYSFSNKPITVYFWKGQPVFVASEVGEAAGYGAGRYFVDTITRRWSSEIHEGEHYIFLTGDDLKEFFSHSASEKVADAKTRHLLLLTEVGVNNTLLKGRTPGCEGLRNFIAKEIMPKLTRNQAILPKDYAVLRDPFIDHKLELLRAEQETLRMTASVMAVRHVNNCMNDGTMPKEAGHAVLTTLFETLTGVAMVGARKKIRTDLTSCTALGERFQMSASMVGRILTWIEEQTDSNIRYHPDYAVREMVAAAHQFEDGLSREVEGFKLTEAGVKLFEFWLPKYIESHATSAAAKSRGPKVSAIRKTLELAKQHQLPFKKVKDTSDA